jgi:hypothetical protein
MSTFQVIKLVQKSQYIKLFMVNPDELINAIHYFLYSDYK